LSISHFGHFRTLCSEHLILTPFEDRRSTAVAHLDSASSWLSTAREEIKPDVQFGQDRLTGRSPAVRR